MTTIQVLIKAWHFYWQPLTTFLTPRRKVILQMYALILLSFALIGASLPAIDLGIALGKVLDSNIPVWLLPLLSFLGGMAFAQEAEYTALRLERGMWSRP